MKNKDLIHRLMEFSLDAEIKVEFTINNECHAGDIDAFQRRNETNKNYIAIETDLTLIPKVTFEQ